jgi:2-keto-3-deoxy-L-fuconate dehydrogenase
LAEIRLEQRRAVITGGASGIGHAIARLFHEAGASVFLLDVNEEMAESAAAAIGRPATAVVCDVADAGSVQRAFGLIAAMGPVDVLVNSAGVAHVGTLLSTTEEDFDRLYRINVRGAYLCMQRAVAAMQSAGSGVILNIASIAATVGLSDRFAYSMSKGAMLAMTLSVAKDYLGENIRCNCISPARVHTPFVDGFIRKNYPGAESEAMQRLSAAQPIGRMGTPDEVAMLALYLCSESASFITGADYPIDGGFLNLR